MRRRSVVAFAFFLTCLAIGLTGHPPAPMGKGSPVPAWRQKRVAFHEAGHAVLYAALIDPATIDRLMVCTIYPGADENLGEMNPGGDLSQMNNTDLLQYSTYALAGQAADELFGAGRTNAARDDVKKANMLVWRMHAQYGMGGTFMWYSDPASTPPEVTTLVEGDLQAAYRCALRVLAANQGVVHALAATLLETAPVDGKRTLRRGDLATFFLRHPIRIPTAKDLPWFCAKEPYDPASAPP